MKVQSKEGLFTSLWRWTDGYNIGYGQRLVRMKQG